MGAQDYLDLLKITVDKKLKKKVVSEVSPTDNAQILMEFKLGELRKKLEEKELNINKLIKKAEKELSDFLKDHGHKSDINTIDKHKVLTDKITKLKHLRNVLLLGAGSAVAIGINRAIKHRKAKDMEDSLKEDINLESVNRQAILDFLNSNIELKDFMKVTETRFYDRWRKLKKDTKHKVKPLVKRTSAQWMLKHKDLK